jgi:hypothetical protein
MGMLFSLGITGCLSKAEKPEETPLVLSEDWHQSITATIFSFALTSTDTKGQSAYNDVSPLTEENPWYVALPFNNRVYPSTSIYNSQVLKNYWLEIINPANNLTCFAQVEDAGPWFVNDDAYVFDPTHRPFSETAFGSMYDIYKTAGIGRIVTNNAGIDLSPTVAQYIGITGKGPVHWRFADPAKITSGPWLTKVSALPPHFLSPLPQPMIFRF